MGQDKRGNERRELPHRAAPGCPWDGLVPPGRRRAGGRAPPPPGSGRVRTSSRRLVKTGAPRGEAWP